MPCVKPSTSPTLGAPWQAFRRWHAARGYAYGTLGWPTAVSYVDAENHRSCALARRLGAREDPAAPRPGPDGLVFRHPSPEALS